MSELAVERLARAFGGVRAVDGVSFALPAGSVTALIGPNGAGKSTLFNLIDGQLAPDAGSIVFEGRSLVGMPTAARAHAGIGRTARARCGAGAAAESRAGRAQRAAGRRAGLWRPEAAGTRAGARRQAAVVADGRADREHSMDVVFGHAERIIVLSRGRVIADGPPAEIRADAAVQAVYLGRDT